MPSAGTARLVGLTATLSCLATLAAVWVAWWVGEKVYPTPTPTLPTPARLTVFMFAGSVGPRPVEVPPADFDKVLRLVTPGRYYGDSRLAPPDVYLLTAAVVITPDHGRAPVTVFVHNQGDNPTLVTVDGRAYFHGAYTESGNGTHDLRGLVRQLADGAARP